MTVESFRTGGPRVAGQAGVLPACRVEEEFLLLRPDGDAACVAAHVLDTVSSELRVRPGPTPFQVVTTTGPCAELPALSGELSIARRALAEAAADQGARLVALGSPPFSAPEPAGATRGSTGAGATCGLAIRVGLPTRESGVAVLDRCRGWLPVLLALSGNSPFALGRDTGWSSHRFVLQERHRVAEPSPESSWAGLSSRGSALDFRIADACATAVDTVLLTGLVRALTAAALTSEAAGRPAAALPDAVVEASAWAAARWGLGAYVVDPSRGGVAPAADVLARLVATVAPALEAAGDLVLVTALLGARLRRGSGAERQRALRHRCDRASFVQTLANSCAGVDR